MAELDDPRIAMILARRAESTAPDKPGRRRRCAACNSTWTVGVQCPTCHPDAARRDPEPPNPAARSGMVARCPECGHRINTFSRWCGGCGKCVAKPEPPPPPRVVVVKAEPKPSPPPKPGPMPLDRAALADVAKTIRDALKRIERAVAELERHARTTS